MKYALHKNLNAIYAESHMHANTTLHFDINSGIAGDMALAVLHGLGGLDLSEVTDIIHQITGKTLDINIEKKHS